MVTAAQAAALIAAISLAVLAAAGTYTLIRLARLISEASSAVAEWRARSDHLLAQANSAVARAHEQLTRTGEITANMDEVSASMADLTADMSLLTRAVRTLVGGPLDRLAGFAFGLRRAVALRRAGPVAFFAARVADPASRGVAPGPNPQSPALTRVALTGQRHSGQRRPPLARGKKVAR